MDVPGRQIGPGPLPEIFVFYPHRTVRSGRQSGLLTASRLNAGLFVNGNHEVTGEARSRLAAKEHARRGLFRSSPASPEESRLKQCRNGTKNAGSGQPLIVTASEITLRA